MGNREHPELRPVRYRCRSEELTGTNVGVFPRHSFLRFDLSYEPYVSPLILACAGDDEWVEGCYRKRVNSLAAVVEFVYAGNMVFRSRGREYLIEPGTAFIIRPGSTTEMETGPIGFCRKVAAFLEGNLVTEVIRESGLEHEDVVTIADPTAYLECMNGAVRVLRDVPRDAAHALSLYAWAALQYLGSSIKGTTKRPEILVEAMEYVGSELRNQLTLKGLCAAVGTSESTLSRMFRAHLGVSPIGYVISQRMALATHLLRTTMLSVKEVSTRCGYSNQLYFSMEFRKRMGVSPTQWREDGDAA